MYDIPYTQQIISESAYNVGGFLETLYDEAGHILSEIKHSGVPMGRKVGVKYETRTIIPVKTVFEHSHALSVKTKRTIMPAGSLIISNISPICLRMKHRNIRQVLPILHG